MVRLSEVCEIQRGGSPRPIDDYMTEATDGINWIKIGDVAEGAKYITSTKEKIRPEGAQRSRVVHEGDFLLSNSMSFGRPYILRISGCIHDGWLVLRYDKTKLTEDYLYRVLGSDYVYAQFVKLAVGAVVKNLNSELVRQVSIPLPPLEVQRRIAAILDHADDLRAKRQDALAQLDRLSRAIFLEMFRCDGIFPVTVEANPARHPDGWKWELLTDVARLATGHTPDRKRKEYWNGDIPWITLTEIRKFDGVTAHATRENITKAGIDNSSAVLLPKGTICFSRTASVGFVTIMGREMATSQDFVNWICGPSLLPEYLLHALIVSRERLRALSTGSTHKTIYFPTVEQFRVLLPPVELQRSFTARMEALSQLKTKAFESLDALNALFSSLQQRAFQRAI